MPNLDEQLYGAAFTALLPWVERTYPDVDVATVVLAIEAFLSRLGEAQAQLPSN